MLRLEVVSRGQVLGIVSRSDVPVSVWAPASVALQRVGGAGPKAGDEHAIEMEHQMAAMTYEQANA